MKGFFRRRLCGFLLGPLKSSRNKGVVFLTGWSYGEVQSYFMNDHREETRQVNSHLRTIMDFFFFFTTQSTKE